MLEKSQDKFLNKLSSFKAFLFKVKGGLNLKCVAKKITTVPIIAIVCAGKNIKCASKYFKNPDMFVHNVLHILWNGVSFSPSQIVKDSSGVALRITFFVILNGCSLCRKKQSCELFFKRRQMWTIKPSQSSYWAKRSIYFVLFTKIKIFHEKGNFLKEKYFI